MSKYAIKTVMTLGIYAAVGFLTGAISTHTAVAAPPAEGEIRVSGRVVPTLQQAFDYVVNDGIIRIGPGVYEQAGVLKKNNVRIMASKGAVFQNTTTKGKGTFVLAGNDIILEGVTCKGVEVPDQNGSCVRFEGTNLTLRNVTFTDSEQGLLAGDKAGKIIIENSRFERLGKAGRAHGIYVNGGELEIRRSFFLHSVDQGHEIKSRARRTTIEYNVIASMGGDDSRLIDLANGGIAIIRENLLVEGPQTVNWQLLAFGPEGKRYAANFLRLEKNMIITDRPGGSELVLVGKDMPRPAIRGNIIVGNIRYDRWPQDNFFFDSRSDIDLPPAPALPDWNPAANSAQ